MRISFLNRFQHQAQAAKKVETQQQPATTLKLVTSDTFTKSVSNTSETTTPLTSLKEKIQALFSKDTFKKIKGLFTKALVEKFLKLLKNEVFDKILALFDNKLFQTVMNFLNKELFSKIKDIIVNTLQGNTQTSNTEKINTLDIAA